MARHQTHSVRFQRQLLQEYLGGETLPVRSLAQQEEEPAIAEALSLAGEDAAW